MSEREPELQDAVLSALAEVWAENPRLRLCQFLINAIAPETQCPEVYYVEDSQLLEKLESLRKRPSESKASRL